MQGPVEEVVENLARCSSKCDRVCHRFLWCGCAIERLFLLQVEGSVSRRRRGGFRDLRNLRALRGPSSKVKGAARPSIPRGMGWRDHRGRHRTLSWSLAALLATLAAVSAACSSRPATKATQHLQAGERDFRIWLGASSIHTGPTSIVLHSRGPSTHEFKIARTDLPPGRLPLGPDGLTVDEQSPLLSDVQRLAIVDIGQTVTLSVKLPPGQYVIFCNFEGHYLGGMHVGLRVDGPPG